MSRKLGLTMALGRRPQLQQTRRETIESTYAKSALVMVIFTVAPIVSLHCPAHAQADSKGFLPVSLQCAAGKSVQVLYQDPAGRRLRYEVQYSADEASVARAFLAKSLQARFDLAAKINFKKETVPAYITLGREIVLKIAWAKYACENAAEQMRQEAIMARNRAQLADP